MICVSSVPCALMYLFFCSIVGTVMMKGLQAVSSMKLSNFDFMMRSPFFE